MSNTSIEGSFINCFEISIQKTVPLIFDMDWLEEIQNCGAEFDDVPLAAKWSLGLVAAWLQNQEHF